MPSRQPPPFAPAAALRGERSAPAAARSASSWCARGGREGAGGAGCSWTSRLRKPRSNDEDTQAPAVPPPSPREERPRDQGGVTACAIVPGGKVGPLGRGRLGPTHRKHRQKGPGWGRPNRVRGDSTGFDSWACDRSLARAPHPRRRAQKTTAAPITIEAAARLCAALRGYPRTSRPVRRTVGCRGCGGARSCSTPPGCPAPGTP